MTNPNQQQPKQIALTDIVVRMLDEIAELKLRVAALEGKSISGCVPCIAHSITEGAHPAQPGEPVLFKCSHCGQEYAQTI